MKKLFLSLVILMIAGLQTVNAQGFRVYNSDGTVLQFSLRTDSIVFYDGIGSEQDLGLFTPANQCIVGTWYKSKSESVTFYEDGTTDYNEYGDEWIGGKYEFFPFQGNVVIYSNTRNRCLLFHVAKLTKDSMIMGRTGASDKFYVYTRTQPEQLVTQIILNETSITLHPDEIKMLTATVLPEDADNPAVTWESSNENVAEVNKNGRIIANDEGTCTITCRAMDGSGVYAECAVTVEATSTINGHDYVEIGGLKWATMNVGATTVAGDYATCYGDYFAWGETEPRYSSITRTSAKDAIFTWKDDYASGHSSDKFPTYTGNTLDAEHDVATVVWGSSWRTPTSEEFKALAKACSGSEDRQTPVELINTITQGGIYWLSATQTLESAYTGVAGILFVSASDITKRVFFPASSGINGTRIANGGTDGLYWSSSIINTGVDGFASILHFDWVERFINPWSALYRYYGFPVRPVSD